MQAWYRLLLLLYCFHFQSPKPRGNEHRCCARRTRLLYSDKALAWFKEEEGEVAYVFVSALEQLDV